MESGCFVPLNNTTFFTNCKKFYNYEENGIDRKHRK